VKSENLTLKKPLQEDYDSLCKVKPCDEFYLMVGSEPAESVFASREKLEKSFKELLNKENYWFVYKDLEIIGAAFLHSLEANDNRARYAIGIYNKENWNRGYGHEIAQAVLKHAFHNLKLHKIDLRVLAYNKRAIASYRKSGFIQEGVLRENAFIDGKWHDDIIMSVLCHEFHGE